MRIVSGLLGGRVFEAPNSSRTHPMAERVRGGLFNTLGDIEGLTVLDAFSGSGALALEAASRQAGTILAIESDRLAQQAIQVNIKNLQVSQQVKLVKATITAWLSTSDDYFDIIFTDPPYENLQLPILAQLSQRVKPSGLFVLSWPGKEKSPDFDDFEQVKCTNYGDAQLVFYRRIS